MRFATSNSTILSAATAVGLLREMLRVPSDSLSLILGGNFNEIDREIKDILTITEKETDRLIRLINDILDLAKMDAKKLPLDLEYKKWITNLVRRRISANTCA